MKITKKKTYLTLSGLILLAVGSYISFGTMAYLDHFGISIPKNISFYSDLRSMGGSLFIFGLIAIIGSFNKKFEDAAIITSVSVFSSYGIFRIAAISMDGFPSSIILTATFVEIIFALIGFKFLITRNNKELA